MAAAISKVSLLLQPRTRAFFALWSIVSLFLFLYHVVPALRYHILQPSSSTRPQYDFTAGLFDSTLLTVGTTTAATSHGDATAVTATTSRESLIADALRDRNVSVHLVLATRAQDDVSWATDPGRLRIPGVANLRVVRYVSDVADAPYRPPVLHKGREALMYLTYLHDFYDDLPDVAILVHADEYAWHAEPALGTSMSTMLSRFDLREVLEDDADYEAHKKRTKSRHTWPSDRPSSDHTHRHISERDSTMKTKGSGRRGYANLRTSWLHACPDWINTTKTPAESVKQEEPFMREAFLENFGPVVGDNEVFSQQPPPPEEVPEILAGPCCSQFAVSRAAAPARSTSAAWNSSRRRPGPTTSRAAPGSTCGRTCSGARGATAPSSGRHCAACTASASRRRRRRRGGRTGGASARPCGSRSSSGRSWATPASRHGPAAACASSGTGCAKSSRRRSGAARTSRAWAGTAWGMCTSFSHTYKYFNSKGL